MAATPSLVTEFLRGRRIAVAGVSRDHRQAANGIFRTLRARGYDAVPINPRAQQLEGTACFPDLGAVPGSVDGVVIATHPDASSEVVRQAAERGVSRVWLHRSLGQGSVSEAAVRECAARGIQCIAGGCPLMFCEPVDIFHRCLRWSLGRLGRIPR